MVESLIPVLGEVIADRYQLDGVLGEGGMGVVYYARDLQLKRSVALKILLPSLTTRADARVRFEREARVAAKFRHPNAVRIFDFGEHKQRLYLAMERLYGETLHGRLRRKPPMSVTEVARIGHQITDVLDAAHQFGLVHRDIKPGNLFLEAAIAPSDASAVEPPRASSGTYDIAEQQPRVILLDFGLAFLEDPKPNADESVLGRLTEEGGHSGGTPAYMSPEQACSVDPGPPSDIYAFGCVLFEMLCGRPPFCGRGMGQVLSQHLYAVPPDVRSIRSDTPAALAALINRMISKRPSERPKAPLIRKCLAALMSDKESVRGRSRDASFLRSRAERMLTPYVSTEGSAQATSQPSICLAVVGDYDGEMCLALATNGVTVVPFAADMDEGAADAIFATDVSKTQLQPLIARGLPVITDADSMDAVASLLRAGVTDVVIRPVRSDDLARKVQRAVRRHHRKARVS